MLSNNMTNRSHFRLRRADSDRKGPIVTPGQYMA
jgi:hypothetical protein